MSFAKRLTKIFLERNLTQVEVAETLGVSRQAIARWLNGTSEPEREKLEALAKLLALSPAYLMFGELDSVSRNSNNPSRFSNETTSSSIVLTLVQDKQGTTPIREIKATREWICHFDAHSNADHIYIFEINSDGMSPTLSKGDFALVNTKITDFIGDGLYLLDQHGCLQVKRIQQLSDNSITLISDNKNYRSEIINRQNDQLNIVGKLVAHININKI